jgi:acetyl-CoA C-acetyltransferase
MTDIVIAGALRTAIGKFGGALAKVPAPELGATVIRALLAQHNVAPDRVSEVILGQVLTAAAGNADYPPLAPAPGSYVVEKVSA